MKLDARTRNLTNLVVGCVMCLLVSILLLWLNPNKIQMLSEPSLFELAAKGNTFAADVLLFGIHDLYDAQEITISYDVLLLLSLTSDTVRELSGVSNVHVGPIHYSPIRIPPAAQTYRAADASVTFLPTASPRLQVFLHEDTIIVMEQAA